MKESGYYPEGAEFDPNAPWNEKEIPKEEIEVEVTVTLRKKVRLEVEKYRLDDYDFENDIKDQVVMPQQAYKYLAKDLEERKKVLPSLTGWELYDLDYRY